MESIPPSGETEWIEKAVWDMNNKSKIEFKLDRKISNMDFKLAVNCTSACWKGMIPDSEEIVLAVRVFHDSVITGQVKAFSLVTK